MNIDFETRSAVDLRRSGVYVYAADPTTDVWCMAYQPEDADDPLLWRPGEPVPPEIVAHADGGDFFAWNSGFEHVIWRDILVPRYGFPALDVRQWRDTAAQAAAMSLPRGLGDCAAALGLKQQKDDAGYRLMMKMSRPRGVGAWHLVWGGDRNLGVFATKAAADERRKLEGLKPSDVHIWKDDHTLVWWDWDPALGDYCLQDVRSEREVGKYVWPLYEPERAVFLMTQRMNDHGVPVDRDLVEAAQDVLTVAMDDANARLAGITGGEVTSVTQVQPLREWVNAHSDLNLESLTKDVVRDLLAGALPNGPVRDVLQIRADAGKTSTAKLDAFLRCLSRDDRARGLLLYHGAGTGRWAGRLVQPQNFVRPEMDPELYIPLVLARDFAALRESEFSIPSIIASMMRSMIRAEPGTTFMCADYSQVEARVLAWIAGQDDLVDLFRRGGKVYETMASFIFSIPVEEIAKDSFERQIGKNSELGFGFQMGEDRFAEQVQQQTGIVLDRGGWVCHGFDYAPEEDALDTGHLPTYCLTCGTNLPRPDLALLAKNTYRERRPKIKQFWGDIEAAALKAVRNPGKVFEVGEGAPIRYKMAGNYLWCRLPSGRKLCYANPSIREKALPEPYQDIIKESLCYLGVDSMTKQWRRQWSYGGHLTENVVQAMARDLIAGGMLRLQQAGYTPILTVHDEALAQVPEDRADFAHFMSLVTTVPRWAEGLPLAGEGWVGERYRK